MLDKFNGETVSEIQFVTQTCHSNVRYTQLLSNWFANKMSF